MARWYGKGRFQDREALDVLQISAISDQNRETAMLLLTPL